MEGHRVRRQRSSTTKTKQPEPLERIQPNAAGIDCGSRHHHVAVPVDRDPEPVRRFKTFTPDLYRMVDWLEACRIDTVAMEATGVYWIPIYDILEQRGFKVVLVNARHVKNVPGRKTDVVDCQWIQERHCQVNESGTYEGRLIRDQAAVTAVHTVNARARNIR